MLISRFKNEVMNLKQLIKAHSFYVLIPTAQSDAICILTTFKPHRIVERHILETDLLGHRTKVGLL